jgi:MYXO-CTERM domain-containing protein
MFSSARFAPLATLIALSAWTASAQAHVSYSGRDLGTFSGAVAATHTIANQTVSGNYGWADGADADWGDSHKLRWFKFTLGQSATVTLTASANPGATPASVGGLIPGFSLYSGLAPSAAYDTSAVSAAYRATLGFATEGAFNALGDFRIGNDSGVIQTLGFIGASLDGVGYLGDGSANGTTSRTFQLAAGTYSLLVGGGDYLAQLPGNPGLLQGYGVSTSISVTPVPEPQALALALAGLGVVAGLRRRMRPAHA